jgi:hypothetical protein
MGHLSPEILLDIAEGTPAASAGAHLAVCAECRGEVETLRATIGLAQSAHVPEPSPLFWDHLSARVKTAVEAETLRQPAWSFTRIGWFGGVLATAAALVMAVVLVSRGPAAPATDEAAAGATSSTDATLPASGDTIAMPDASDDPSLSLLMDLAGELDWESTASGLAVRTSMADGALSDLDADERTELGRLLREELGSSGV